MSKCWLTILFVFFSLTVLAQEKLELMPADIKTTFIKVPKGQFKMGSVPNYENTQKDEFPQSEVTISFDFYLGMTEVTQELWFKVMKYNPSVFKDPNRPVEMVTWNDCMKFIEKLNQSWEGEGSFRMPTEAEWEYAARLAEPPFRDDSGKIENWKLQKYAWFYSRAEGQSKAVATKMPDKMGFYDLLGNLWEWCSDWKGNYPEGNKTDPQGPSNGNKKVYRGGSWFNEPEALRPENRNAHPPDVPFTNAGLRLVYQINK